MSGLKPESFRAYFAKLRRGASKLKDRRDPPGERKVCGPRAKGFYQRVISLGLFDPS